LEGFENRRGFFEGEPFEWNFAHEKPPGQDAKGGGVFVTINWETRNSTKNSIFGSKNNFESS